MSSYYIVLFDIDGTLLHSHGAGRRAMKKAMEEVFGTAGALEGYNMAGRSDLQTVLVVLSAAGIPEEHVWEHLPKYRRAFARYLEEELRSQPPTALPGARELIARLHHRSDVVLGLITGNIEEGARLKLMYAGFDPQVFHVAAFGNEALDRDELAALALRHAAEAGILVEKGRPVVVGDTPLDIKSGRAVGARVVAVATGPYPEERLAALQPDVLLPNLADVNRAEAAILGL